ncbi:MAG TPA: Rieske (2Fe-2S) protein [Ktedonobacteraceae bacterium]|nr:Rieske (2Fe-2S) protein [Ktedonobacteraceae bacterium]
MAGEDQERFEDYLELERFIEDLQAGRVSHAPERLTPDQARIYRMATLFHAASIEEAAPRPEFVAELQARLEQVQAETTRGTSTRKALPFFSRKSHATSHVSRRALLTGGAAAAVAAASLSVGVGISHAVDTQEADGLKGQLKETRNQLAQATQWGAGESIVGSGIDAIWHPVTALDKLGDEPVSFNAGGIVGYVIRNDGDSGDPSDGKVVAVSAACTHMGCIVQWQAADKKFHCPCHDGTFTEYGKTDAHSPMRYLKPLPRLEIQIDPDGTIKVRVPNLPATTTTAL